MSEFYKRLSQLSENKGFNSINKFALDGLNYASSEKLNRLKKENTSPSFEIIIDISNKFEDVNLNWLITGKGEMYGSNIFSTEDIDEIFAQLNEPIERYGSDNKIINAQQKAIQVLESYVTELKTNVTELRNDKNILYQVIQQRLQEQKH